MLGRVIYGPRNVILKKLFERFYLDFSMTQTSEMTKKNQVGKNYNTTKWWAIEQTFG